MPDRPSDDRICPLCSGPERRTYGVLRALAQGPYHRCLECGLVHARPDPATERRFYQEVYPSYPHRRTEAAARIPLFARLLDRLPARASGRRLLDVGCGTGHFLALARQRGWDVTGFDVSPPLATQARELSGAPVHVADELDQVNLDPPYDVITLWNVIDQVGDAVRLLGDVLLLLAPGGLLYARVPNGSFHRPLMRLAAILGPAAAREGLERLTPVHPWVLRPADLRRLLVRTGYTRIEVRGTELTKGDPAQPAQRSRLSALALAKTALGSTTLALERLSRGRLTLSPSLEAFASRERAET